MADKSAETNESNSDKSPKVASNEAAKVESPAKPAAMTTMVAAAPVLWLVKANDQILGPFVADEISKRIVSRDLVLIDEVCLPTGRWRFIRDEPTFAVAVEESRKSLMNAREETEVEGYTSTQLSGSQPSDMDLTPVDGLVPVGQMGSAAGASSGSSRGEAGPSLDEPVLSRHAPDTDPYKQFGLKGESRWSSQTIAMWVIAIAIVVIAVYLIAGNRSSSPDRDIASLDFTRSSAEADRAWMRGDFSTAERLYAQANRSQPLQMNVVVRLAPLMMQIEGQTVEAKRLLNDTEAANQSRAPSANAPKLKLGLGLAALFGTEYKDADLILSQAEAAGADRVIAESDLGMSAFLQSQFEMAAQHFEKAGTEPLTLFMRARALSLESKDKGVHQEAGRLLTTLTKTYFDYKQEGELLSAIYKLENNDKEAALGHVRAALALDPEMTADHWHDPLIYQAPAQWKSFIPLCKRLFDELNESNSRALLSLCLAKAGQKEDAAKALNDGLMVDGEDPTLQSVNAYLLAMDSRDDDAKAALRLAEKQTPAPPLARIVKARLCIRADDLSCAEDQWKSLADDRALSLSTSVGLAEVAKKRGNFQAAKDLAEKALAQSPRYRPALSMIDPSRIEGATRP